MVLEVDEFTQEFAYHSNRDRWLAREAIGYGTLRGLALSWSFDKDSSGTVQPKLMVTSGVALSPCGQLICVRSNQCADINLWLAARDAELSRQFDAAASSAALTLYVTLAYIDCPTDDAPVPGEPCRSEQDLMQASRITDSFQLELSYDAPPQDEEDAVRHFSGWLRKINVDPTPGKSLDRDKFVAAIRAWNTSASDSTLLTVSAVDVPDYFAAAMRLWVTELRPSLERAGARQRFETWLNAVPVNAGPTGLASDSEFLAEVRRWTPRTNTWPDKLLVDNADGVKKGLIARALNLWDAEIAPKWFGEVCGCRTPISQVSCDDRLLLGALELKLEKTAGNPWRLVVPAAPSADTPSLDESQRPILSHLRSLQEQMSPSEGAKLLVRSALGPPKLQSGQPLALGRLCKARPQVTPVFGNARIVAVEDGKVSFSFDNYSKPDSEHDYVVQVLASYFISTTSNKSQPAVRFGGFTDADFYYMVTRANKPVIKAELELMEFQVEVSLIVKQT
jgi:hypothetical protein